MRNASLLVLALSIVACDRGSTSGAPGDTGLALATSSSAKDSLVRVKDSLLAEKSRQLSEQSQLLGDAVTSARLASQIDRTLASVRGVKDKKEASGAESSLPTTAAQLEAVDRKVKLLITRLNASEARVRRMRNDSTTHATADAEQVARLNEYERSIGELRATVERQQQEIAMLMGRVDSVTKVNVTLAARVDTVTAQNVAMAAREDSAFVVIATEKELIDKGIARKEGGNRLLFRIGRTLVPSRDFDAANFHVISKAKDVTIEFPRADKSYRLVSRHNLQFTDAAAVRDAKVKGTLHITNPAAFWASSKYLIFAEQWRVDG